MSIVYCEKCYNRITARDGICECSVEPKPVFKVDVASFYIKDGNDDVIVQVTLDDDNIMFEQELSFSDLKAVLTIIEQKRAEYLNLL